jgi:hypothetical protein
MESVKSKKSSKKNKEIQAASNADAEDNCTSRSLASSSSTSKSTLKSSLASPLNFLKKKIANVHTFSMRNNMEGNTNDNYEEDTNGDLSLPREIIVHIFSLLELKDICFVVPLVCR